MKFSTNPLIKKLIIHGDVFDNNSRSLQSYMKTVQNLIEEVEIKRLDGNIIVDFHLMKTKDNKYYGPIYIYLETFEENKNEVQ